MITPHYKHLTKKQKVTMIDRSMNIVAIIHPLMAVPQVYQIYATQNVAGVSLLTWLGFMLMGGVFLAYGIVHNLRPIIMTQVLWFAVDFLVVVGILLYR